MNMRNGSVEKSSSQSHIFFFLNLGLFFLLWCLFLWLLFFLLLGSWLSGAGGWGWSSGSDLWQAWSDQLVHVLALQGLDESVEIGVSDVGVGRSEDGFQISGS